MEKMAFPPYYNKLTDIITILLDNAGTREYQGIRGHIRLAYLILYHKGFEGAPAGVLIVVEGKLRRKSANIYYSHKKLL